MCSRSGSIPIRVHTSRRCWTNTSISSTSYASVRIVNNANVCCSSPHRTCCVCGRSKVLEAWVRWSPSSWSPWARRCWMCRRSCRHGRGRSTTSARTRTTPTTCAQRRSSGSATAGSSSSVRRTTRRCCACSQSVTMTWSAGAPSRSVGCMRCWPRGPSEVFPACFRPIGRLASCVGSVPQTRSGSPAARLRSSSWARSATRIGNRRAPHADRRGRPGHRHDGHQRVRGGADRGRVPYRLHRRRHPVRDQGALRPLQRDRTDERVVGTQPAASVNDRGNRQLNDAIHIAAVPRSRTTPPDVTTTSASAPNGTATKKRSAH